MLSDMRVLTKMMVPVALSVSIVCLVFVFAIIGLNHVNDDGQSLYQSQVVPMSYLDEVHASELKSRLDLHRVVVATTEAERQERLTGLRETDAELAEATEGYRRTSPLADSSAMRQYETNWAKYISFRDERLLPLALSGAQAEFTALHADQAQPLVSQAADGIDQLVAEHKLLAEQAATSASDARRTSVIWVLTVSALGVVFLVTLGWMIARRVVNPLRQVSTVVDALAAGDLTATTRLSNKDEIGQMAQALDHAIERTRSTLESVGVSAERVAWVTDQSNLLNQDISARANATSQKSEEVDNTAQEVSENVQTIAGATEEMRSSIAEIGNSSTQAATVASEAVTAAHATREAIGRLSASTAEIDTVVRAITSIAGQTNLLALNATIEAARAGEAGKGFAVVAGEVKDLSQETAQATTSIVAQINAIQVDTSQAVESMDRIVKIVDQIAQYQDTIAAAVEEQAATATDIGRSLFKASEGSATIASHMREVAESAVETTHSVGEAGKASADLVEVSGELQGLVTRFHW